MMHSETFANQAQLDKLTRTIEKVHGANHPELIEVRQLFLAMQEEQAQTKEYEVRMARLREVTNHYTPPADACQAYQRTYQMLKEMDDRCQS
ncbi:hypothetical protein ACYSNO_07315 [Enterococcus sp. LJL98]